MSLPHAAKPWHLYAYGIDAYVTFCHVLQAFTYLHHALSLLVSDKGVWPQVRSISALTYVDTCDSWKVEHHMLA